MPSLSPEAVASAGFQARLTDPATGFNPNYTAALINYPAAPAFAFDFSTTSKNYFLGRITADELQESTVFTYPLMLIYASAAANRNTQKFQRFAGPAKVYVEVILSNKNLRGTHIKHDVESWANAVSGAMLETFNGPAADNFFSTSVPLLYNGEWAVQRGELESKGSNWRQKLTYIMTCEVIIP